MPRPKVHRPAGLSAEQETALLAIEQAMADLTAHGDALSQWRLLLIGRALDALEHGRHHAALEWIRRAETPEHAVPPEEREEAQRLQAEAELARLRAALGRWRAGD